MSSNKVDDKNIITNLILDKLKYIFSNNNFISITSLALASEISQQHNAILGSLYSLDNKKQIRLSSQKERLKYHLTEEGSHYADHGCPEMQIYFFLLKSKKPIYLSDLNGIFKDDEIKIGFSTGLKLKLFSFDKSTQCLKPNQIDNREDLYQDCLKIIRDFNAEQSYEINLIKKLEKHGGDSILKILKKRKLIHLQTIKYYDIHKGSEFLNELRNYATDLTQEMILKDSWKELEFKPYNFFAKGIKPLCGSIHPLNQTAKEFKSIFIKMGFSEMPTDSWVENSFWNFDVLFQPQQHPARDIQDTFFLKDPSIGNTDFLPKEFVSKVKQMHESGGYGSLGWRYEWSLDEAKKNVLRTHTTANTARLLYALAKDLQNNKITLPCRYFSIDRVFRNETLDATHLAEFHQIEGVVIDYNLSLASLMGILKTFYNQIGIFKLRFKPTFNPYTEPSMEIFGYHPDLARWIEVGNSGIFRPEMLLPMGFSENISVVAWGLSLERPTMIKHNIRNIRDLFGPKAILNRQNY